MKERLKREKKEDVKQGGVEEFSRERRNGHQGDVVNDGAKC